MNNKLYIGRIFILVGKLILGVSFSSIIYIFYKFISIADIKVTIAFFEAKFMSLFSSTYKVTYTNQHGMIVEEYIPIFLNDPYLGYTLLKYKLALYNGLNLSFFILLTIIVMTWYYRAEITAIIEDFLYQHLREKQLSIKTNHEPSKPKIIPQRSDKKPIEYQDI